MVVTARLAVCAALILALLTAPALAQQPFSQPKLRDKPKGGFSGQATATPAATATATPTASATAEPTATPRHRTASLPNTGADPLRLALAGFALIGFGLALRFRVALHARPPL